MALWWLFDRRSRRAAVAGVLDLADLTGTHSSMSWVYDSLNGNCREHPGYDFDIKSCKISGQDPRRAPPRTPGIPCSERGPRVRMLRVDLRAKSDFRVVSMRPAVPGRAVLRLGLVCRGNAERHATARPPCVDSAAVWAYGHSSSAEAVVPSSPGRGFLVRCR